MIIFVHCFPINFSFRYSDLLALAEDLEDIKTTTRTRTLRNVASRRAVAAATTGGSSGGGGSSGSSNNPSNNKSSIRGKHKHPPTDSEEESSDVSNTTLQLHSLVTHRFAFKDSNRFSSINLNPFLHYSKDAWF